MHLSQIKQGPQETSLPQSLHGPGSLNSKSLSFVEPFLATDLILLKISLLSAFPVEPQLPFILGGGAIYFLITIAAARVGIS